MSHFVSSKRMLVVMLTAVTVLLLGLTAVVSAIDTVVEPLNSTTAVPANVCPGLVAENWCRWLVRL